MRMVKFELRNTINNSKAITSFNKTVNAISLSSQSTGFALSFTDMVLEEDPERTTSADGTIELTFKGNKAI